MARMRVSCVNSLDFEHACMVCKMSFGCIIKKDDGSGILDIICFYPGDAEVIVETLTGFGGILLGIAYLEKGE